ncbi:BAG family molecular chaperone regulator 2-like [Diospyros lotus]|uniref:BAG family molecular chaperone regulator 2-like n=1 Tax=Diospyros lotus TaxID=55363 RepID=UPI0022551DFA|nr:BAG family molecular chaperone regulator 2-like [Diospyros lotus]
MKSAQETVPISMSTCHNLTASKLTILRSQVQVQHPLFPPLPELGAREKRERMMKLRSKRFSRSNSKLGVGGEGKSCGGEIKWELRPGGMLVQKRESGEGEKEPPITVRVSTVSQCHDITIQATSTFGELKMILSLVTGLEPRAQRVLFKGKEREDCEYLHMVGVGDKDKVLLLEDPAIKEKKLLDQAIGTPCRTIRVQY